MDANEGDRLSALIKFHASRHEASQALRGSVLAELALESAAGGRRRSAARPWFGLRWRWASMGFASGALPACLAMLLIQGQGRGTDTAAIESELVGEHIRSLMVGHLTDVASSDHHTVKPWFQGKLDYSPPVDDFAAQGFALLGGRLEYIDGKPVAALVYRRHQHIINAFVWPSADAPAKRPAVLQGFNLVPCQSQAMQYWLVSDLNTAELKAFASLLQQGALPRP